MTAKDFEEMLKNGVSMETIHALHDNTVTCSIDQEELIEHAKNGWKMHEDSYMKVENPKQ